ncbi:MAG: DUF3526 domain-containing protein [Acidobacteriota bacterium]
MTSFWKHTILLFVLALITAAVLLFASNNTSQLHDAQRKVHALINREPQSSDPGTTFVEISLEPSPTAQLSSGYTGIAPSIHLIRLGAPRPLSHVNSIEHPSRRRWGRIDFSFAFLLYLPIALIPLAFFIYRRCTERDDLDKLLSGRTSILDFSMERILLPLLGSAGFLGLVTLACIYSAGLRLSNNDILARIAVWVLLIGLYLLGWILLYAFFLLRRRSFAVATIHYGAAFLLIAFILPQSLQTVSLALERPRGRLPLIVERRKLAQQIRRDDRAGVDRYLEREGFSRLEWSKPLSSSEFAAIENLRIEQQARPLLEEFENSVRRMDQLSLLTSWISPYLVAQFGVDDLAGTGLARYSDFRSAAIEYHEQWRKHLLGFLARRQFLDFDSLRRLPRFRFSGNESNTILLSACVRCGYLALLCLVLAAGIRSRLNQLLPKPHKDKKKAAF